MLDLEFKAATLGTAELTDWVIAFSDRVVELRGTNAAPIIYCSQGFANNEFDARPAAYDLWLRTVGTGAGPAVGGRPGVGFTDPTGVFDNWSFWQYSDSGSSGGISPLDLNVCHSEFKLLTSFVITPMPNPALPFVTGQPRSQTIALDGGVTSAVAISVTSIPGAIQPGYTLANAQLSDAGAYTVVITNAAGSVTSTVAAVGPDVEISFSSVGGHSYVVQRAASPGLGFIDLSGVMTDSGDGEGIMTFSRLGVATNVSGYYRVRLAP